MAVPASRVGALPGLTEANRRWWTLAGTCMGLFVLMLAQVDASSGYGLLFCGYLLFGIALGCVYAPMSAAAMTAMPPAKAGIAAGVLAMNRVLAGAITLAAAGAVFQVMLDDDLHAGQVEQGAFASALSGSMWLLVGVCAVGTVLTWAFVRASDDDGVAPEHQSHRHFHLPWVARLSARSEAHPTLGRTENGE